jgi:hypothetical protein
MGHLLATVLPFALGAAISPILFAVEILALTSSRSPRLRAWLVVAGSLAAITAFSLLGLGLGASLPHHHPHPRVDGAIDIVAAGLLGWLGLRAWRRRGEARPGHTTIVDRLDGAPTRTFFLAGVLGMVTNFSTLVLYLPALRAISKASVSPAEKALCLAIVLVITLLVVWVPAAIVTIAGRHATPTLEALNRVLAAKSAQITTAICLGFGIYLAIKAILELT